MFHVSQPGKTMIAAREHRCRLGFAQCRRFIIIQEGNHLLLATQDLEKERLKQTHMQEQLIWRTRDHR